MNNDLAGIQSVQYNTKLVGTIKWVKIFNYTYDAYHAYSYMQFFFFYSTNYCTIGESQVTFGTDSSYEFSNRNQIEEIYRFTTDPNTHKVRLAFKYLNNIGTKQEVGLYIELGSYYALTRFTYLNLSQETINQKLKFDIQITSLEDSDMDRIYENGQIV